MGGDGAAPEIGVRVLQKFLRGHVTDEDQRRRFKGIGIGEDTKALGLPSMGEKFNGKPMIVSKTGERFTGKTEDGKTDFFEMDMNVHEFPFLARKTLSMVQEKDLFPKMRLHCGFVIQGEENDELPEVMCGSI